MHKSSNHCSLDQTAIDAIAFDHTCFRLNRSRSLLSQAVKFEFIRVYSTSNYLRNSKNALNQVTKGIRVLSSERLTERRRWCHEECGKSRGVT